MFDTSEPAPGSVIAIQILLRPVMRLGTKRSWREGEPNFRMGGRPNDSCCYGARGAERSIAGHFIDIDEGVEVIEVFYLQIAR